jgi:O-methyltransferase
MKKNIYEFLKKMAFKYTNILNPKYQYLVEPIQLAFLVNFLSEKKDLTGSVLEVGVDKGFTTRFLCEHIKSENLDVKYFVVDTFNSFTNEDINYEVINRGKSRDNPDFMNFKFNDYETWSSKFKDFTFLHPYKSDCSVFDYNLIGPFKLVFLDVDLYLPTIRALNKIWEEMVPGGCIMVDNVSVNYDIYDGAHQAYHEFCETNNLQVSYIGKNSGIIYKN